MSKLRDLLSSIPWPVWLGFAVPPLLWVVGQLTDGTPVSVVMGGGLVQEEMVQVPEGAIVDLEIIESELVADTEVRVHQVMNDRTFVVMFGFDESAINSEAEVLKAVEAFERLARRGESTGIVPVLVGPDPEHGPWARMLKERWRAEVCRRQGLRMCLDLAALAPDERTERVRRTLATAIERREGWRLSTQVGR